MDTKAKVVAVGYCIAILCAVTFVPWVHTVQGQVRYTEYAFLWKEPFGLSIDYGRVALKVIAITAIATVCYLLREWLVELLLRLINVPPDPPKRS